MRISDESNILDKDFRAQVITEIESSENVLRKKEAKRRYDLFNDFTKYYIIERIRREMGETTAKIVINRVANISIAKKIINKKARVYKDGIVRQAYNKDGTINEEAQAQIAKLYGCLGVNSTMKKTNKWNELQRNASNRILPFKCPVSQKYKLKIQPLNPFLYDVIEDDTNPEMPLVYIFSYFNRRNAANTATVDSTDRSTNNLMTSFRTGDYRDQIIADSPEDKDLPLKHYVWWSYNYHFTTDEKGEVIEGLQETDNSNPFQLLPFVDFSRYQDGQYWSVGGDDLPDNSILVNMLLTDLNYAQMFQGFGYFYLFGKNIPANFEISPRKGITIKVEEGDPTPSMGFANPNFDADKHLRVIDETIALLLSTNDLEPGTIQGQLSATNAESGVQEMIKRSINTDDIEDQQQIYKDGEALQYKIIARIFNYYFDKQLLVDDLMEIGRLNEDVRLVAKFSKPSPYMTEKEKLDAIGQRQDLGLDSRIDSLMRDNPDLSKEEAEAKVKEIEEDKAEIQKILLESKNDNEDTTEPMDNKVNMNMGEDNGTQQSDLQT